MRNGSPAVFASREETPCAADTHTRDGYPNSDRMNDRYTRRVDPDIEG
jgi:hypothetical protein